MSASDPNRPELRPPSREELAVAPTQALRPDEPSSQLVELLDGYLAELQSGRRPDRVKLLAQHPDLAAQLEQCLSGIEFIHQASVVRPTSEPLGQLGDFRIVREVGRGGMGVVYEAEQVTLKRRVALKVLRYGAAADSEAMQRFQREAETVATLHHTNIVPIFAIGCENGVNYYAMQFIEGRSLADSFQRNPGEPGGVSPRTFSATVQVRGLTPPGSPDQSSEIANWGLQAAEALAHAHQRGVIHRDIKPSNLILDPDGRIWLTDFGLAKRMDDVSLSTAGAILGTPRYMSPEQAAASKNPVDHRTDIYSLGATLYELATGRPLFEGDSPHLVITQILTTEPPAPRVICPNLPRDVETIIVKCLAKEPERRYATAQALADDLRAFVEGRAIKARRSTLAEQAARWFKQQKRSVGIAAAAVAATIAVVVGSLIAWQMHGQSRLGYLTLNTPREGDQRAEVAEVLSLDDVPVLAPFTLSTKEPVALPEGAYRLRLTAPSKVSQTYLFDVAAGTSVTHEVGLVNETVGYAIPLRSAVGVDVIANSFNGKPKATVFPQSDGRSADAFGLPLNEPRLFVGPQASSKPTLRCYSANSQPGWKPDGSRETEVAPLWEANWSLEAPDIVAFLKLPADREAWKVLPAQTDVFAWQQVLTWFDPWWFHNGTPPQIMQPTHDLNGDGVADVIWAAPRIAQPLTNSFGPGPLTPKAAVLVAASGKDGQPLWWFRPQDANGGAAALMTSPVWTRDETIVCAMRSVNMPARWLEAINARTGESLWRLEMPPASGSKHQPVHFWASLEVVSPRVETERSFVVATVSQFVVAVDIETGKTLWEPHDLGRLLRLPRLADLNGDGLVEVLSVTVVEGGTPQLTVTSLSDRKPLWSAPLTWFPESSPMVWPDVVDLEDDGRSEVLLPNNESRSKTYGTGVRVLDGATGQQKWSRWFPNSPHQRKRAQTKSERYAVGPDLDGDGLRELFRASIRSEFRPRLAQEGHSHHYEEHMLFVDCFSGRDGRSLWWQRVPLGLTEYAAMTGTIGEMLWWGSANAISRNALASGSELGQTSAANEPDASAFRLIVPIHRHPDTQDYGGTHSLFVLSAATGRVERQADDLGFPKLVDWNNDGLDDLAVIVPDDPVVFGNRHQYPNRMDGKFVVLRGSPPEAFRRLDRWIEEQDFDGDGIAELSRPMGGMGVNYAVQIASGRDGRIMSKWKSEWPETPRSFTVGELHSFAPPLGDFDGDGLADLLITRESRFWDFEGTALLKAGRLPLLMQAISGKTGKRVWGGGTIPLPDWLRPTNMDDRSPEWQQARSNNLTSTLTRAVDLDGDHRPELLEVLGASANRHDAAKPGSLVRWQQQFVALVDGRDGSVRWIEPITEPASSDNYWVNVSSRLPVDPSTDLNGDGTLDVLIVVPNRDAQGWWTGTLQARSGHDGKLLWPAQPIDGKWVDSAGLKPPLIGDLDGDGRPEIVLYETIQPQLRVLRGDTGETLWTWKASQNLSQMVPSVVLVADFPRRAEGRQPPDDSQRSSDVRVPTPTGSPKSRCVAVTTYETNNNPELVLLDHAGQIVERISYGSNQLWAHDLDGDGLEELLRPGNNKITASRGWHDTLWEWSHPAEFGHAFVSRFERTADGRTVVVVASGDSLALIDGPTGKPLGRTWKSTNTSLQENNRMVDLNHANLATPFENSRLLTRVGDGTVMLNHVVSRAVLPADAGGRYATSAQRSRHAPRDEPNVPATSNLGASSVKTSTANARSAHHAERDGYVDDPRLIRQLPWAPSPAEWVGFRIILLKHVSIAVTLSLIVLLTPFWLIRAGVRRCELGRWRIALIAGGVALFAICMIALRSRMFLTEMDGAPWGVQCIYAGGGLAILAWPTTLLRSAWLGQWRRVRWQLGGTLLASVVLAIIILATEFSNKPPEQHYSWNGWWFILLFGAYGVGSLLVLWRMFGPGMLWLWKFGKRRFARHA